MSGHLIDVPNGKTRVQFGIVGATTTDPLRLSSQSPVIVNLDLGNAGFGEGGHDNQLFLTTDGGTALFTMAPNQNIHGVGVQQGVGSDIPTDQLGLNDHSSFPADGHPVQPQLNSSMIDGETVSFRNVDEVLESYVVDHRTLIDQSAVGVADFQIGLDDPAKPGSDRTVDTLP